MISIYQWLSQPHQWLSNAWSIVSTVVIIVLLFMLHRYRREYRQTRFELKASIQAGELLAREVDNLTTLALLLDRSNYQLACQVHGRDVVDRAIAEAHERGVN